MNCKRLAGVAAAAILHGSTAFAGTVVTVPDVAGTWTGTVSCKGTTFEGLSDKKTFSVEMKAQGSFDQVAILISSEFAARGGGGDEPTGCGLLVAKAPGSDSSGAMHLDSLNAVGLPLNSLLEAGGANLKVKVFEEKRGVSGKITGTSFLPRSLGTVGTCKWKLVRSRTSVDLFNDSLC
jgi:hypothetical protein